MQDYPKGNMQPPNRSPVSPRIQALLTIMMAFCITGIIFFGLYLNGSIVLSPSLTGSIRLQTINSGLSQATNTMENQLEDWPTRPAQAMNTLTPLPTPTSTPPPTYTPIPTPIVIGSWRELGHLTTLQSTLQTVVEVNREDMLGGLIGGHRLLLKAVGNVEAGIDLTQITGSDIFIDGNHIELRLPHASITSVEILPHETEILDVEWRGGILLGSERLEIDALDEARIQLESWAVDRAGMLLRAEEIAAYQLSEFLRQLGFETVIITFDPRDATKIEVGDGE